jgi:hypothetical protein
MRRSLVLLSLLVAGCVPAVKINTDLCNPATEVCYTVSGPFLERHLDIRHENDDMRSALRQCHKRL